MISQCPLVTRISFIFGICTLLLAYAKRCKVSSGASCSSKYRGMHISLNLVLEVLLVKYIDFKLLDQATNDTLAETARTTLEIVVYSY